MNVGVTFTAHHRPLYFRRTLFSWATAHDALRYPFYFSMEPGYPEMVDLAKTFPFTEKIWVNEETYGALGNPWYALSRAFDRGHDFVILAEDDAVVSHDVLVYFEEMAHRFEHHPEIFAICSFNHERNGDYDEFHRRRWFASTVWGVWAERWHREIKRSWGWDYAPPGPWDKRFVLGLNDSRVCIFPCVSRSQHIGKEGGTHMPPLDFDRLAADSFYQGPAVDEWRERVV